MVFLETNGTNALVAAGGGSGELSSPKRMPYASTDLGRIAVWLTFGAGGREEWFYSDYFEIRPDTTVADEPPSIDLVSPQFGDAYVGGGIVPVAWTASDDEGLRSFDIQASYDGGSTWWTVVRNLASDATSYDLPLPDSMGVNDMRIRVIARDRRFQITTTGMNVSFDILPGSGPALGDINGDGLVNMNDVPLFSAALAGSPQSPAHTDRSDLNQDGVPNGNDIPMLMQLLLPN